MKRSVNIKNLGFHVGRGNYRLGGVCKETNLYCRFFYLFNGGAQPLKNNVDICYIKSFHCAKVLTLTQIFCLNMYDRKIAMYNLQYCV